MTANSEVIRIRFKGSLAKFSLDVSFKLPMRGIGAVFGPSGSGKTTILRCISGLTRLPGELVVGNEVWQSDTIFLQPHSRAVGYVFQEASLFPHLSVRGNLLYGRQRALKSGAVEEIRVDDVIAMLDLGRLLERATAALSGGERQRVAIGRALLSQPRLLLMDEPLAALDRSSKLDLLPYFETLHEKLSIPILYVSHDISEVERLADVLVLIDNGRLIRSGPIADVLAEGDLPLAQTPEAAVVVEAMVTGFDARYGLTELGFEGQKLLVTGRVGEIGKTRRVRIAAADISLARERPSQTSILNVLAVRIKSIHVLNESQVNVVVTVGHSDGSTKLLARISTRALEALNFASGQHIYAQVKTVALIA
jgi:molybdate transport system ATP-binding protein